MNNKIKLEILDNFKMCLELLNNSLNLYYKELEKSQETPVLTSSSVNKLSEFPQTTSNDIKSVKTGKNRIDILKIYNDFYSHKQGRELTVEQRKIMWDLYTNIGVFHPNDLSIIDTIVVRGRYGNMPILFLKCRKLCNNTLTVNEKKNITNFLKNLYCRLYNCPTKYYELSVCTYKSWLNYPNDKKLGNGCNKDNIVINYNRLIQTSIQNITDYLTK